MDINRTGGVSPPISGVDINRQKAEQISSSARFMDVLAMMQGDGVIAQDAETLVEALTDEQKEAFREKFDIADIVGMSGRREVLNELIELGALTAHDSELSMMQLLPPAAGGIAMGSGWETGAGFEAMLAEPNYLTHLEQALEFDGRFGRSGEAVDARQKVYDLLQDIYSE